MDSNLVKARSAIVWMLALACAFGAVWWIERQSGRELIERAPPAAPAAAAPLALKASADLPAPPAPRALTPQEQAWARAAWQYFERNTDAGTGLTGSVEGFSGGTLWDMASSLLALLAARELQLLDANAFDARMALALASLARLPLYAGELPNKSYDVRTLAMTDYANQPTQAGIGWSAIDLGRLLVPLNVIAWQHPRHTAAARTVIARWNTARLARDGLLQGMEAGGNGDPRLVQEGRLGYEQYAARGFQLMGLDVETALDWRHQLAFVAVSGVEVPVDRRDPQRFGAQNPVVSEPYLLDGLEFGWTRTARELAWRVYRAQEARHRETGVLTAVTEDHVDAPPHFVYNAVHNAGRPWATISEKGEDVARLRSLSVKAAFGWHALLRTDYTARLVAAVAPLHDPQKGWYAGRYEEGGRTNTSITANTNAVVLESLAYIARGPFLRLR